VNPYSPVGCSTDLSALELKASTTKTVLAVNETDFTVKFTLRNRGSVPVCVESGFAIGDNLYPRLKGPMGDVILRWPEVDKVARKEYFTGEKMYSEDLTIYDGYYTLNGTNKEFSWNVTGDYTLVVEFYGWHSQNQKVQTDPLQFKIQ